MHDCARCGSSVGDAFRFCPWCAAPQRLKLVEFFRARQTEDAGKALRVSRYLHDDLDERHVRFSIWDDARVQAAVSLEDNEADRLGRFLLDTAPQSRNAFRELLDRVAAIRFWGELLGAGDRVPEATVWLAPREPATCTGLVEDGHALFAFFLFAWSSTWTSELELLRDRRAEFEEARVTPFAISRDSPYTQTAWSQALDLDEIQFLSDWNAEAVRGFGVGHEYRGMKDVAERTAFLVGRGGTVRGAWRYDTGEVPDFDELLAAAQAL